MRLGTIFIRLSAENTDPNELAEVLANIKPMEVA